MSLRDYRRLLYVKRTSEKEDICQHLSEYDKYKIVKLDKVQDNYGID